MKAEKAMNYNKRSVHVLPASSNLMGFCLIVQASLHVTGYSEKTRIDEVTAVATFLFMVSCVFSYLAIRASRPQIGARHEAVADISFIAGLLVLFVMVLMMTFKLMH